MAMNYVTTMEISPVKLNLEAEEHCPETVSLASMVPFWDSSALLERSFLTQKPSKLIRVSFQVDGSSNVECLHLSSDQLSILKPL